MTIDFQGTLLAQDFLTESIREQDDYRAISDEQIRAINTTLIDIFTQFPKNTKPNEQQTEDDLIWKVLETIGWHDHLRQQNLSNKGREDVPDGLLFLDAATKAKANEKTAEWQRFDFGAAIVESKRWARPLDRRTKQSSDVGTPSNQILNYLSRADALTDRKLKWGMLTNGQVWRLYWQDAKSRRNDYFGLDLEALLAEPEDEARYHGLRVFTLVFGREGFWERGTDNRTFHARALEVARLYEARVAENLSVKIFERVFPRVVRAIAAAAPDAELSEIREESLVLLYRLLFILYAEDRDLLPVHDSRYDDYGLRMRVRNDVGERLAANDVFSDSAARYWSVFTDLCRGIDKGDGSIGIPPYNGGLFNSERHELLDTIRIPDTVMVELIDDMCFEMGEDGTRKYINYRDLSVQQLGSVYERLLEYEVIREDGGQIDIRPNIFARKGSGSYYTPDDLVGLILEETLRPLINQAKETSDPASAILDLKICDPAMGSGHFLVSLVDFLSDEIGTAIEETGTSSRLITLIEKTRANILSNAKDGNWIIKEEHLDDPHIIRRMVLKRCIYGVDKNPMAVELAKVALWLHTFTVGAPLSFLDHHLKCGDSLFGMWVFDWKEHVEAISGPLLSGPLLREAVSAESIMETIEMLADADIDQVRQSKSAYGELMDKVSDLDEFMSFAVALKWMKLSKTDMGAIGAFYNEHFGPPTAIMAGIRPPRKKVNGSERFTEIWREARELMEEENFFHWQVAFPGVWKNWQRVNPQGGFDAIIGNPPWDRIKLQQVEWFAERRPDIAALPRAADRRKAIAKLKANEDPLYEDYIRADTRAKTRLSQARVKRKGGADKDERQAGKIFHDQYYWLGRGDVNLYSLFVERAAQLLRPGGMMGLLVPSGIASDKTAAPFFKGIATTGRLKVLYDFENKKIFFPDVHASFKFCVFVAGPPTEDPAHCAFYLHSVETLNNPDRRFPITSADFARINPNTGTAPIFRTRRDAELTKAIYGRLPVLVDRSSGEEVKAWPVKYVRMFDMANDSEKFRTIEELKKDEKAFPIGCNRWESSDGFWVPLNQGRTIHQYDHRYAGTVYNENSMINRYTSEATTLAEHRDPNHFTPAQYFVREDQLGRQENREPLIAYRRIARATDARTMLASIVHNAGFPDSLFLLTSDGELSSKNPILSEAIANLNSVPYDYVMRQKLGGTNLSWFVLEQLPVVPPEIYETYRFGPQTAREVVREAVLELTYTAHDMAPFAKDMGYVDEEGDVKPPFIWDEERRLYLKAKLDAVYFILYGITDPDDVDYIYSTFPIVRRQEERDHGRFLTRDLAKHWINALQAGRPDAEIKA